MSDIFWFLGAAFWFFVGGLSTVGVGWILWVSTTGSDIGMSILGVLPSELDSLKKIAAKGEIDEIDIAVIRRLLERETDISAAEDLRKAEPVGD